jgi:hypothetical protein
VVGRGEESRIGVSSCRGRLVGVSVAVEQETGLRVGGSRSWTCCGGKGGTGIVRDGSSCVSVDGGRRRPGHVSGSEHDAGGLHRQQRMALPMSRKNDPDAPNFGR